MEAVILGLLMFIAFSLFRLPYAGVVAMLTAILAFVPYIGAFTACFVGALLTLIGQPSKLILCILVYQGVQFIENQFIYPRVVGSSVGLPPLWTLAAALHDPEIATAPGHAGGAVDAQPGRQRRRCPQACRSRAGSAGHSCRGSATTPVAWGRPPPGG